MSGCLHEKERWGAPEGAPFDRIVVTAACSDIASAWLDQLGPGGLLLAPTQHGHLDPLLEIRVPDPARGCVVARAVGSASFMPLAGVLAGPNAWQSYLIGGMVAASNGLRGMPFDLPKIGDAHPLTDSMHQAIHFFLALASRAPWQTHKGYELADPHDGAAALDTSMGLELLFRLGAESSTHKAGGEAGAAARRLGQVRPSGSERLRHRLRAQVRASQAPGRREGVDDRTDALWSDRSAEQLGDCPFQPAGPQEHHGV